MTESFQPQSIGKYEILGVIGKGGMGVVYKARDPIIDRTVAIKTIRRSEFSEDQQLLARLRMEAKSAGRLHHPNIVTIFDFGEQDDLAYLVMEYVEGANLARVISSGAPIPLNTKMEIVIQLCDGLAYAHDLGVIHRDIKPSNICLTERGDPKLLDFGLARFDQTRLTRTGLTSGTLSYMSPERLSGESGPSDDIFALGAVAYEIFTGKCAFPGNTMGEIVNSIRSGAYPIPPSQVADVPSELDAVIARATASQKSERFKTAKDFGRALRDVQHSATFQRRIVASESASDVFKTMAMQSPLENPYTAPEFIARASDMTETAARPLTAPGIETRPKTVVAPKPAAAPRVAAPAPRFEPAPAPPPAADPVAYAKTEMISSPSFAPPTGASPAPTVIGSGPAERPPVERTVVAERKKPAISAIFDITRTVMARAMTKKRTAPAHTGGSHTPATVLSFIGVVPQSTAAVSYNNPMIFGIAAAALIVAAAAMSFAWSAGAFPFLATYAAAVGAWFYVVKYGEKASLQSVILIALAVHAATIWPDPLNQAALDRELAIGRVVLGTPMPGVITAGTPPLAAVLYAGWAAVGGAVIVRRLVLVVATLIAASLMWDAKKPRRALGLATFPLLIVEGTLNARFELLAGVMLLGAMVAVARRRDGVAGMLTIFASGIAAAAVISIPVVYDASWQMFIFLGAALVSIVVPKIILPSTTTWSAALATLVSGSPFLAFLAHRVELLLGEWGTGSVLNGLLTAIATRIGTTHDPITDFALASAVVVIVLIIAIWIYAVRTESSEAGMADAIGLTLLVLVTIDPALWLLVVPFAIAGNRRFWLLAAICSPILVFARAEGSVNWIVWAVSLAIPAAWYVSLRLQDAAEVDAVTTAQKARV